MPLRLVADEPVSAPEVTAEVPADVARRVAGLRRSGAPINQRR